MNKRNNSWIIFFLTSLETLIQRLEQKYDVFKSKGGYLNGRQKRIKEFIEKQQPIKLSVLSKMFTEISVHTLKKDLQYLKTEQIIISIGKNCGTIYIINKK